ncbi:sigma factor [Victivallis vadensis]|uniref:sigma factor n=1 Tax=Victivallis vadensis TaxID=172901 RepID=UPI0023F89556|nr:sigma factor [Victivallis vadensis]
MTAEDSEYIERCVNVRAWHVAQICHSLHSLDDYRQELRIAVFRRLDRFDPNRANMRTYCDRITRSVARLLIRRHRRMQRMEQREVADNGRYIRNAQLMLDVAATVAALPPDLQQIVADLQAGKSYRRMSAERGVTRWTFERRYILPLRDICNRRGLADYLTGE